MIALSIITGFLGSGKTTLLNHLLAHPQMDSTAVLINEFGEIGLDHLLVKRLSEDVVLLKSGCICCTVKGELVDGLKELYLRRLAEETPAFSRVVIETTGLADPLPIISCILTDPLFKHVFRLDSLITTVDALYGSSQLDRHTEAVRQAAVADRLVLTKTDLAGAAALADLEQRLRMLNPSAALLPARFGHMEPRELFGAGYFDSHKKSDQVRSWLNDAAFKAQSSVDHVDAAHSPGHEHRIDLNRHDDRIRSFCITLEQPIPWNVFREWYDDLAEKSGGSLLRVKGIVSIDGNAEPYVIHCVQATQHEPSPLDAWPDSDHRSRIVFITDDLGREEIEADLRHRLATAAKPASVFKHSLAKSQSAAAQRWLDKAELSRLFAALASEVDSAGADVIRLMLLTGVSVDDACGARREDLDDKRGSWTLPAAAKARGPIRPKPRRIPLGGAAKMLVRARLDEWGGEGYLFSQTAEAIETSRCERIWAAAAERAGIDATDLHKLAPVIASDIFEGLPPELSRTLLGLKAPP